MVSFPTFPSWEEINLSCGTYPDKYIMCNLMRYETIDMYLIKRRVAAMESKVCMRST